jgi:RNA polymerase II-associated factor 1
MLSHSCIFDSVSNLPCNRKPLPQHIDISRPAQLRDIEASFAACNDPSQFDLSALRHPNKPNVTAIESYEIYPDADIWANAYDLFRFSERPGERPVDVGGGCLLLFELG